MKQFTSLICLLLGFFINNIEAQISSGGQPYSFNNHSLTSKKIPTAVMPSIDLAALKAEDALNAGNKQVFRFGESIAVDLSLQNAGKWETLDNGDRIWRLQIYAKGANTINLIYNHFYLPQGAKLFLYTPNKSEILGAFTSKNNKTHQQFSTSLLKGDKTILEYYEPAKVANQGIIHISEVIHGYRGFKPIAAEIEKGFDDSGSCNINVNCSDGDDWQVQKRSVAMIIAGGKRDCTGALVNNVREDGTPYFLTANHCLPNNSSEVQTWLFMFNYESPSCENEDGRTDQTISGAEIRASSQDSDFALLELSAVPPIEYQIYFAGWSAEDVAATESTCIHHPSGDIKKISFNEDLLINDKLDNTPPNSFWQVTEWEKGTTEGGSSGSPLFDAHKRIVGQLFGGFASCTNISWDTYGKFSYSWDKGNSIDSRLKEWLDPDDTGTRIIEGIEGNKPDFELDASLLSISSPSSFVCHPQFISPRVLLRNVGEQVLTSAEISYTLDDSTTETLVWEGNLDFFDSEWISFPPVYVEAGEHQLEIAIQSTNGRTDMGELNNQVNIDFEVSNGSLLKVNLNTDNFGSETSFQIVDEEGAVVVEEANFNDNRNYQFEYCLTPQCYIFTIFDSFEGPDGLGDGICCQNGLGSYAVSVEDEPPLKEGGEFRSEESFQFCIEDKLVLEAAFTANRTEICKGDTVQFTALSEGAANYTWAFEGGTPAVSVEPNPVVVFEDWGNFNVSLKVKNSLSEAELEQEDYIEVSGTDITLLSSPASNPISQDGGVSLELSSSSPVADLTFEWSNGATSLESGQWTRGNHSVLVSDPNGCQTTQNFFVDSEIPPIVAMVQVDSRKICEGQTVHLIDVSNNTAVNRQWSFEGAALSESDQIGVYLQYTEVGSHDVQLIVQDEYTSDTLLLSDFIEVGKLPDIEVESVLPQIGQENGSISLKVSDPTSSISYSWNNGAMGSQLSNLAEGDYQVSIQNEFGCEETFDISLKSSIDLQDGFLAYPNPVVDGNLLLYNNNSADIPVAFKIYSLEGRLMGTWTLNKNTPNYSLDVSTFPSGVYLLRATIGEKEQQEKLILQND